MDMLRIKEKDIIVDKSELLYRADFSNGGLEKDFEIAGGKWIAENGGVLGYMEEDGGGLIYSYRSFKGDVLLDFYGKIIAPYDNDLNFTFCADGWNYKKGIPKPGYVGGLQGWWIGKCGIEKYPLKNKVQALAKIKDFDASTEHHIQTGRAGNNLFLFVDGELVVEMLDKKPLNKYGRVGLGVYASKIFFRDFKVYKPYVKKFETSYEELRKQNLSEF